MIADDTQYIIGRIEKLDDKPVVIGENKLSIKAKPDGYVVSYTQLSRWLQYVQHFKCEYPNTCPGKVVSDGNACCFRCSTVQEIQAVLNKEQTTSVPVSNLQFNME